MSCSDNEGVILEPSDEIILRLSGLGVNFPGGEVYR